MKNKEISEAGNAVEIEAEEGFLDSRTVKHPIDKGWAWMVLLGAFLETLLLIGSRRTYGILFKEFMSSYNASATEVALGMTIQTVFVSIASLLILSIGTRCCSTRVYVMLGGVFGGLAYFINSFATGVPLLLLSQGIFFGLTHACCHGPALVTVGMYFSKRKGMANLLASVGGTIGAVSFPLLVQVLLENYGLQGVLLILSGVMLHFSVAGALLRPTSFYEREEHTKAKKFIVEMDDNTDTPDNVHTHVIQMDNITDKNTQLSNSYNEMHLLPTQRIRTYSNNSMAETEPTENHTTSLLTLHKIVDKLSDTKVSATLGSTVDIVGSFCSLPGATFETLRTELQRNQSRKMFCCETLHLRLKSIMSIIFNKDVLCNRLFRMFITVVCFAIIGVAQIASFLPAHAEDIGISKKDIVLLLTVMGCIEILSKFLLSFISDLNFIKRHHLLALSCLITGTVVNFVHYFHDFYTILILGVTYGLFGQWYTGLFPSLVADFVGVSNMSAGMSFVVLSHGAMMSITSPIIGFIRDTTGSFELAFNFMGICLIIAGVISCMEPIFRKLEENRIQSKDTRKQ